MNQLTEGSVPVPVVTLPPAPELCHAHRAKARPHDAAAPSTGVSRTKSWAPATVQTTKPPSLSKQQLLLFPEVTTLSKGCCNVSSSKPPDTREQIVLKASCS